MSMVAPGPDTTFYPKRARDECELALAARDVRARRAHLELLRSYLDRLTDPALRDGDDA